MLRSTWRQLVSGVFVLLAIAYLSFLLQGFALHTRAREASAPVRLLQDAVTDTVALCKGILRGDLGSYDSGYWYSVPKPLSAVIGGLLLRSLGLLLLSMCVGGVIGASVGFLAAAIRRRSVSLGLMVLSVVGISTPSFFLGMLLQHLEITFYKHSGLRLLPVGGFGWDGHLVLPVLVLSARPVAQVTRLTYARVTSVLNQDYVRTAQGKGLRSFRVWSGHILPNAVGSVLTAMYTSMRFSLSSLPVVEYLFGWPGIGKALLEMLQSLQRREATVLLVTMGAVFVLFDVLLDLIHHLIDPRLHEAAMVHTEEGFGEWVLSMLQGLWAMLTLRRWRRREQRGDELLPLPSSREGGSDKERDATWRKERWRTWGRAIVRNPALLMGLAISCLLFVAYVGGPSLAPHNPYSIHTRLSVHGQKVSPPVSPTRMYPLGTDTHGRDILSLLIVGARRTLSIALLAVIVRLLVGATLGFLAGWFPGSRLDRILMGLSETQAAFPALLLAMLLVYAVGIRKGLTAFVVALSVIGWGEVMQTVRGRVAHIKPTKYVEGAVATGLPPGQILIAHVLPNVWPTIVSLAFLEMGGVLMILGELGFLGVFIGGGLAASGDGFPAVTYYDIPEWSVMLADSWRSFRSFPWITLYPALAFFLAILGFTLLGLGIRDLTERLTLSMRTLFNRYTLLASVLIVLGARLALKSNSFYAQYASIAQQIDASRAMADVEHLADESYNGRLSGTADAATAAQWIAGTFEDLGLQPIGDSLHSYFQTRTVYYRDLVETPSLEFVGADGQRLCAVYGRDFVRERGYGDTGGSGAGQVALVAPSQQYYSSASVAASDYGLSLEDFNRQDRILLRLVEDRTAKAYRIGRSGVLQMHRGVLPTSSYLLPSQASQSTDPIATVLVTQDLVQRLAQGSGYSLQALERKIEEKKDGRALYLPLDWHARLNVPMAYRKTEVHNVIGLWPGTDITLNSEVIIVAAYYDGLGRGPDGTLYPGANDNASGVATMLEIARTLREAEFQPKRSILFVAWIGGERYQAVDYEDFLRGKQDLAAFWEIVAGLELQGVGAGRGSSAVISSVTSERLMRVLRESAQAMNLSLEEYGSALHMDRTLWPAPDNEIPSATVSWLGSDVLAHTPQDTAANVDAQKVSKVGKMTSLAVMVLASDPAY